MVDKALAQSGLALPSFQLPTPAAGFQGSFGDLIGTLILWVIIIGALVALGFILIGGFTYISAGDDASKAEGARKTITNGVIGLIIVASAFILWRLIATLLNLDEFFGL